MFCSALEMNAGKNALSLRLRTRAGGTRAGGLWDRFEHGLRRPCESCVRWLRVRNVHHRLAAHDRFVYVEADDFDASGQLRAKQRIAKLHDVAGFHRFLHIAKSAAQSTSRASASAITSDVVGTATAWMHSSGQTLPFGQGGFKQVMLPPELNAQPHLATFAQDKRAKAMEYPLFSIGSRPAA